MIRAYPIVPRPEIYGLHGNADMVCAQGEGEALLGAVLTLQPRAAQGGGRSQEEEISTLAKDVLAQVGVQIILCHTASPTWLLVSCVH